MIIKHQNWYQCPTCNYRWTDTHDSSCADDCPNCGEHQVAPDCSEELHFADENDVRKAC